MAVAAMLPLLEDHHWHQQTAAYESRLFEEEFLRAGWHIGRDQTAGLMRAAGLQGVRRGRKPITTRPAGEPDARPDLVERRFAAERPHQLWVADITYVRILGGFCLSRFHHRRLHPPDRGVGRVSQSAYPGAAAAGPGTCSGEHGCQPGPGRSDPPLGPTRPVRLSGVLRRADHRRGERLGRNRGRLLRQRPGFRA